jgi:hypothetical protein
MHGILVAAGVLLVAIIAVHIIFKAIKFTLGLFLLGAALITVVYVFQHYLGIDLIAAIFGSA